MTLAPLMVATLFNMLQTKVKTKVKTEMKSLLKVIKALPATDGDGVKINRLAGPSLNEALDPFLLIDEISSDQSADYIGGFPEHPHRGFETVTYMKAGKMRHKDHLGNEGVIEAPGAQWMTAGAGVLHSEMPEQDSGELHGFQIWLNLPSAEKMKPASYLDINAEHIPSHDFGHKRSARVIAGEVMINGISLSGAAPESKRQPLLIDVELSPDTELPLEFHNKGNTLVYVYKGNTQQLRQRELGVYSQQGSLKLQAGDQGAKALILSGNAIAEPIFQYGPFVMNTAAEVEQAFIDLRTGEFLSRSR